MKDTHNCLLHDSTVGGYTHWLTQAQQWMAAGGDFIIITMLSTQGSAPQKAAAKMLVARDKTAGTVGGGTLEHKAITTAQAMLAGGESQRVCVWTLNAAVGQCCGGKVAVLFEHCTATAQPTVALFGLGHVGYEVAMLMQRLPYRLITINTNPQAAVQLPATLPPPLSGEAEYLAALPPKSCVLIMTHTHALDYELCAAAIRRGMQDTAQAFSYIGVIGSAAKATKFRRQLTRQGLDAAQLICPIGKGGKYPAEIALRIAAEVVGHLSPPPAGKDKSAAVLLHALKQSEAVVP